MCDGGCQRQMPPCERRHRCQRDCDFDVCTGCATVRRTAVAPPPPPPPPPPPAAPPPPQPRHTSAARAPPRAAQGGAGGLGAQITRIAAQLQERKDTRRRAQKES